MRVRLRRPAVPEQADRDEEARGDQWRQAVFRLHNAFTGELLQQPVGHCAGYPEPD